MSESKAEHFHPVRQGLQAARANLIPGLILQAIALALVLAYYFIPPVTQWCGGLAQFRSSSGFWFSIISTAIFGGLIPFLYLRLNPKTKNQTPWSFLPFYLVFWAWTGLAIDAFYQFQAQIFGSTADVGTVIKKVAMDQFVYNPIYAAPIQTLAFFWKEQHFSFSAFRTYSWRDFFLNKIPTTLISTWGVWLPMVSIVYSLPSDLQVPLFNLVLCFWVLILTTLTRTKPENIASEGDQL